MNNITIEVDTKARAFVTPLAFYSLNLTMLVIELFIRHSALWLLLVSVVGMSSSVVWLENVLQRQNVIVARAATYATLNAVIKVMDKEIKKTKEKK